jgi:ubiquinol-cytochrome c reductase cytochrome b subunit
VGKPFFPSFIIKTLAYQMWVFTFVVLMATFVQINPIWLFGPYDPGSISAGSQPDWYMGWLEGSLRLMPAWEIDAFGHSIPMSVLIPALVVPGLIFTTLAVYPFLERWALGDYETHHLLDRPRDVPARVGVGMAGVTFYGVLWLAGGNDIIAKTFEIPLFGTTWFFRIAVIVGPILAFVISRRIALGLQRHDRAVMRHGVETGEIVMRPTGAYEEIERPVDDEEQAVLRSRRLPPTLPPPGPDGAGVEPKGARRARLRQRLNRLYTADIVPPPNGEHEERPAVEPRRPAH